MLCLAHSLAYDLTKTDSIKFYHKGEIQLLTSVKDIRSKVINKINYEGRALIGKSLNLPNVLVIIFRGTDNKCNGIEDARITKVKLTNKTYKPFKDAKVHEGFLKVYKSLRDDIRQTVLDMLKFDSNINSIFIYFFINFLSLNLIIHIFFETLNEIFYLF